MKRTRLITGLLIIAALINSSQQAMAQANSAAPNVPQKQKAAPRNLAILIFDGVQIIDYTGPYETFGHTYKEDGEAFNIYTVSEKSNAITTSMGMSVNPKYSFENAPEPNVLVIPGGGVEGQVKNPNVIRWIQEKAKNAEIVMSVCNGAYILAKAGVLDGLEATTTAGLIPGLRKAAPRTKVVDDKRFVDNGKIITTAGLSSGIDGSLHVIERLFGRGTAQMAALGMEYDWDPDSKFTRAALADKYMRFNYDVKVAEGGWRPLSREGSRDQWENKWLVTTDASAAELLDVINKSIAEDRTFEGSPERSKWSRLDADLAKTSTQSTTQSWWRFTDEKGAPWSGTVGVAAMPERNRYTLSVKITRINGSAQIQNK